MNYKIDIKKFKKLLEEWEASPSEDEFRVFVEKSLNFRQNAHLLKKGEKLLAEIKKISSRYSFPIDIENGGYFIEITALLVGENLKIIDSEDFSKLMKRADFVSVIPKYNNDVISEFKVNLTYVTHDIYFGEQKL